MKKTLVWLMCALPVAAAAQTFNGGGGTILDDGTDMYYPIQVSGVVPNVMNSSYGLETVCIDLTHTWNDDLIISLIAPDGTEFELCYRHGGDSDNFSNTCFNTGAADAISNGWGPFTGTFRPDGPMASVNNGQSPNGTWQLHILDAYPFADTGDLLSWSITFGNQPAAPFPFTQAVLPLVVINTVGGASIHDEPKTMAQMRLINNPNLQPNHLTDPANGYNGMIGIELRGHSSQGMPKRSYKFETRNTDSTNNNVSLLDMPTDNDWVLIANYSDKTLLRNYMSYRIFNKMGRYAPRMQHCEVMLNGEYQGIYLLGESIKRSNGRVDIASIDADDVAGDSLKGGYIFKADWIDGGDVTFQSEYPAVGAADGLNYVVTYPKPEDIQPEQLDYISTYFAAFEDDVFNGPLNDSVNGYREFIDEGSFIDYIILTEFTKNIDGYRLSTYLHKHRNGKIHAGPPWDYDLSWGNADYMYGNLPSAWDYQTQEDYTDQCPAWWARFFEDTLFQHRLRCRWNELREDVLSNAIIKHEIDSLVARMGTSIDLNFTKWPILGQYVWPNPGPIPADYAGEIANIKDWVDMRLAWLDNNWTGTCAPVSGVGVNETIGSEVRLWPNPASNTVRTNGLGAQSTYTIHDSAGRIVTEGVISVNSSLDVSAIAPGIYTLNLRHGTASQTLRLMIQR